MYKIMDTELHSKAVLCGQIQGLVLGIGGVVAVDMYDIKSQLPNKQRPAFCYHLANFWC